MQKTFMLPESLIYLIDNRIATIYFLRKNLAMKVFLFQVADFLLRSK